MKISNKDAKLLYVVGGVLVFVLVYMYGFQPLQEKNAKLLSEIENLEKECDKLEIYYKNIDTYEAKIEEYREAVKQDLALFPADIKEEDIVVYLLNLQEANEIDLMSIEFEEPIDIVNFYGMMDVEGVDQTTRMNGQKIGTVATAELTYKELKDVLQYIYDTQTQTTLEKVTVVYDEENDTLNGSLNFARYILNYEEAEYVPEILPDVAIGQEDLFGED